MSSANPPYPYYNGIPYNKNFFSSNTGGLTVGLANTLYLQKTIQDTATAIETFSSGVLTSSVDVQTTGSGLNLGVSSDSGIINLGTKALRSGAINIGTGTGATSLINIGSNATITAINGTVSCVAMSASNYDAPSYSNNCNFAPIVTSGTVTLAPNITSGSLYIGVPTTSATGRTGTIHIGDGNSLPSSATVHINNGTSNASNTNINNGATTSGTVNVMTGATTSGIVNIATGSGASQTSTVNIATGTTTGTVSIGNSANTASFGCPLTLNYAPSLLTGTNQLGYKIAGTVGTTTITSAGVPYNLYQAACPAGIFLITANVYFNGAGNSQLSINNSVGIDTNCYVVSNFGAGVCLQVTRVVNSQIDGIQTWILVAQNSTAGSTVGSVKFNVYRIA